MPQWRDETLTPIHLLCAAGSVRGIRNPPGDGPQLTPLEAKHLAGLRQVTFGFPARAKGIFPPDGQWIVFQAYPPGYPFYQIYVQRLDEREARRISTGRGRTTCAYFSRDGKKIIFASSHTDPKIGETEEKAARRPARRTSPLSVGFRHEHGNLRVQPRRERPEAADQLARLRCGGQLSFDGKRIVFTSMRAGNPNIYIMDADGSHVRQVTHARPTTAARSSRPTIVGSSSVATDSGKTCCSSMRSPSTGRTKCS